MRKCRIGFQKGERQKAWTRLRRQSCPVPLPWQGKSLSPAHLLSSYKLGTPWPDEICKSLVHRVHQGHHAPKRLRTTMRLEPSRAIRLTAIETRFSAFKASQ